MENRWKKERKNSKKNLYIYIVYNTVEKRLIYKLEYTENTIKIVNSIYKNHGITKSIGFGVSGIIINQGIFNLFNCCMFLINLKDKKNV